MKRKISNVRISSHKIKSKKKSKFIQCSLIEYSKEKCEVEFLMLMKQGYENMAEINLELSQDTLVSGNADLDEYEKWLCGV